MIEKVIKHCGESFRNEFVEPVLQMFFDFSGEKKLEGEKKLDLICLDILITLINFKKIQIKPKIELIIKRINSLFFNYEENKELREVINKLL